MTYSQPMEARRRTEVERFTQGVELSLGMTRSLRRHRREIERSDTVAEAWGDVGSALDAAMTKAPETTTRSS